MTNKLIIILLTLIAVTQFSIFGYILISNYPSSNLSGVRGGARSGFHLGGGESISIASTSPMFDFVIYKDEDLLSGATTTPATSTMMIYASSTPGACLILDDYDGGGYTYCTYLDGVQTCSSSDICY